MWVKLLNNGFGDEYIGAAAENPDGSIAVFSRGDLQYLCISQYGADGERLSFRKHQVGNYGIRNAALLGGDYLILLEGRSWGDDGQKGDGQKLMHITKDGEITDSFRYTAEDREYHIVDMMEFDGKLYISAYTTPETAENNYELFSVIRDHNDLNDMPETELTGLIRENYQAVLLICDPAGGIPQQFYAVPGNLAGELKTDENNRLVWQTEDIQAVGYSLATSAFRFYGTSELFEYAFSANGVLESRTETGEMIPFRK